MRTFGIVLERWIGHEEDAGCGNTTFTVIAQSILRIAVSAVGEAQARRIAERDYPGWKVIDVI